MTFTATPERIVLPNQTRKSVIYKDEKGHKFIRKQGKYVKLQKGGFPVTGTECACCINACIIGGIGAVASIAAFVIIACLLNKCSIRSNSRRIQPVSPSQPLAPLQQTMTRRTAFRTPDAVAEINLDLDAINNLVNDPDVIKVLQQETGADSTVLENKLNDMLGEKGFNKLKQLLMSPGQIMLGVGIDKNKIIINPLNRDNLVSILNISGTNIQETQLNKSKSVQIPSLAYSIADKIKGLFDTSQCKVHPSADQPSTSYSSGGKSKPKKSKSK